MSVVARRPEEVGDALIKVHEDLLHIKEKLLNAQSNEVDIQAIQSAIEKTESTIKDKTEQILGTINNKVKTLPSLEEQAAAVSSEEGPYIETTWDLQVAQGVSTPATTTSSTVHRLKDRSHTTATSNKYSFSPAEKLRLSMAQKAMFNPYNDNNRKVMSDNYGVQLPVLSQKPVKSAQPNQKLLLGSTVEPLAALPPANRKDPQLAPPPITEDDARYGILSLLERGLIPPGADLTLDPSPVKQKLVQMHDMEDRKRDKQAIADGLSYNLAGVKLDTSVKGESVSMGHDESVYGGRTQSAISAQDGRNLLKQKSIHMPQTSVPQKTLELQLHPVPQIPSIFGGHHLPPRHRVHAWEGSEIPSLPPLTKGRNDQKLVSYAYKKPPPTTPNLLADQKTVKHRFPIQNGYTRESAPEYLAFRQHYCMNWGPIVSILKKMEKMLTDYAIPIAFVDGDKLSDLALEFELEVQPSVDDLLSAVVNREDVEALVYKPGREFKGPNGEVKAATKIQAQYRMYKQRNEYLLYRHRKWAAGVIALTWIMNVKMATMKKQLIVTRQRELENFKQRTKSLSQSWHRIKRSRRVIIHMPSLGYAQRVRDTLSDFGTIQNTQMARLCDIKDPNVDVIYVSPVPINDECMQYYAKLLALKPAVDSGNVDNQNDLSDRYKIVIPEAIKHFPTHRMCLSTHLKYSPKALNRIKSLIHGREAYIVSGMPHIDDLSVAEFLNVPVLGPEPDVAHLYSTKSGSKRIFHSASVKVPPGEFDIYTFPQLHDSLAQLITDNLDVRTWLFKMDHEFDARGTAYCHIADHLRCYMWAKKECDRYGDKWSKKWAQEPVFNKIHSELSSILDNHCTPLNKHIYPTWQHFLNAFLSRGGVIEATPPSDSVTSLTVSMLIEPDGQINIISSGDQIHAETPYRCWGISTPQCSVEPEDLNKACYSIGEACKARGIMGYFTIDFATYIDSKTGNQELWATDLDLRYDDSAAMNTLIQFMSNGAFSAKEHMFSIPIQVQEKKRRRRRNQPTDDELPPTPDRYAVFSTNLLHSNLTVVHYSVFFQMCRAHGIGFDIKEKQGTVFTLIDSFNRENLGMLALGDNLQGALATFARNLNCIHQEISAPNMQGVTNFKRAIEDIEAILGTTIQNANEVDADFNDEP